MEKNTNMKRYIYKLFVVLLTTSMLFSCSEEEGTEPGNDPNPAVTIFKYEPGESYNVDNDIVLRFAFNNKTTAAYFLAEKSIDKEAYINTSGESAYLDYVVENGEALNVDGESDLDTTLVGLYGEYTITVVAVGENSKFSSETTFTGLDWSDVVSGTYTFFNADEIGIASSSTMLQICTTNEKLYRFKDVFGEGYHLKINLLELTGEDSGGAYTFFRVPNTKTPLSYGDYGSIYVRDIGYWQGNDSFVTSSGYESGMYSDYNCFIMVQYYVGAGSLGYGYDEFTVD